MTTLTEAAENIARLEVPALPVRRTDELDAGLLDAVYAQLGETPKTPNAAEAAKES